ncbi:MAG: DNA polymerase III subunit gamma/tau [Candidatus Hydrogenedentes bacterium]|nr:DNA polymerase III subunit gamma/tau [Candidatus Hydrogenedentota bacterium]
MANDQYLVLARKWRPQAFESVVGQDHITRTLKNAITSGRIHHAFLFIGSRGIGKTTTARILAKALNCLESDKPTPEPCGECSNCASISAGNNLDVIEIDGASNNGVDDVRELRDNIRMMPTNGRYKVYIIDEVHQLSVGAFNALLKTLEEPPPHAVFILATTEAHKIPATIVSRCQRYDFRRVPIPKLIELLRNILDKEGLKATDEALHAIARAAEGGVRDSESILDELITYCNGEITFQDVFDVLGLVDWQVMHDLCDAILDKDVTRQLLIVEQVASAGKDLTQFVQELLRYFRNLLVCKTANVKELLHLPEEELAAMNQRAARVSLTNLIRLVEQFAELVNSFDSQLAQRIALEAMLIRISKVGVEVSVDTIMEKLIALGQGGIGMGAPVTMEAENTPPPAPRAKEPVAAAPKTPAPKPAETPPDPPEAEPAPPAPAAPAAPRRIEASEGNLARLWSSIIQQASEQDLSLGTWFGQGRPIALEGSTLILEAPANADNASAFMSDAKNRAAMAEILRAATTNLDSVTVRIKKAPENAPASAQRKPAVNGDLPFYPSVNPVEAREVMDDPGIAAVVNTFKGKIADVQVQAELPMESAEP